MCDRRKSRRLCLTRLAEISGENAGAEWCWSQKPMDRNAVEQSAWTALATKHHLRTIQTIVENVCLVSWAAAPCVWTLRALTRNLHTYLLTYLLTYLTGCYYLTWRWCWKTPICFFHHTAQQSNEAVERRSISSYSQQQPESSSTDATQTYLSHHHCIWASPSPYNSAPINSQQPTFCTAIITRLLLLILLLLFHNFGKCILPEGIKNLKQIWLIFSTEMGDRDQVQFPVPDIYFGM